MAKNKFFPEIAAKPWDQLPRENIEEYEIFLIYRDLRGNDRDVENAYRVSVGRQYDADPITIPSRVRVASSRNKWKERAESWDRFLQYQRDSVTADHVKKWEKKRLKSLDESWEICEAIKKIGMEMMKAPLYTEKSMEGGRVIIKKPAGWNMATALDYIMKSAELGAAVLEAATPPIDQLREQELEAIRDARLEIDGEAEGVGGPRPAESDPGQAG